jgi:hypothetical protein
MHPCREHNLFYKSGFLGLGGNTPQATPPPPVPNAGDAAAAAAQQQMLHADVLGQTYASTLLTGAATPANASSVQKSTLLGG